MFSFKVQENLLLFQEYIIQTIVNVLDKRNCVIPSLGHFVRDSVIGPVWKTKESGNLLSQLQNPV
jgi:hypothetical protein